MKIRVKKSTVRKLQRTKRKVKSGLSNGFRGVIRGIFLGIRKGVRSFSNLSTKTQLISLGAVSAVLVTILIIAISGSKGRDNANEGGLLLDGSEYTENFADTETFGEYTFDEEDMEEEGNSAEYLDEYDEIEEASEDETDESTTSGIDTSNFTEMKEGATGTIVSQLQSRLMELGYMDPDEPTELYGPNTEEGIKKFQAHNGLNADGVCGLETYTLLNSEDAKQYVMQLGDEGEDVENVQTRLYELGYITSKSNITGTFGEITLAAAKEFQEKNKLKGDGKVGDKTLETMFDENPVSKCYSIGDKNDVIKQCQTKLKKLGYYSGDCDGEYTKAVKTAVKKFQRCNDLVVDGELGPTTKDTILSKNANSYVIQLGDSGTDVEKIQKRLVKLKYLRSANATGYYGQRTVEAVMAFQDRNKLHSDGKIGTATYNSLFSSSAKKAKSTSSSSSSKSSTTTVTVYNEDGTTTTKKVSNSSGVEKLIEIANSKLGCKYVSGSKGPNTFDCSGFVYYCLKNAGVSISYMTSIGWRSCSRFTRINSLSSCKRGDILVFTGSSSATGHVGIYLGNGKMIDAGSSVGKVRITNTVLSSGGYWPTHFICGYRVF